jgi:uncharacterized membrane protein YbaN (DUF454 family)
MREMAYKFLFVCLGHIFIVLAVIGIYLPLVPTTPFVLVSGACYARGSRRLHAALLNSRLFGGLIRDWQRDKSISVRAKLIAGCMLVLTVGHSLFVIPLVSVKIGFVTVVLVVAGFIFSRPSSVSMVEES